MEILKPEGKIEEDGGDVFVAAETINKELDGVKIVYVVHKGFYLCSVKDEEENGTWDRVGELQEIDGGYPYELSDDIARSGSDEYIWIDIPGSPGGRFMYYNPNTTTD